MPSIRDEHRIAPSGVRAALGVTVGVVGCFAVFLNACDGTTDSPSDGPMSAFADEWPEGTVMTIGGTPILAEEIDRYLPLLEIMEPQFVLNDKRRKIFANIILPRAAARDLLPAEREAAFRKAQDWLVAARETGSVPPGAGRPEVLEGPWLDVGLVLWDEARSTEVGSFSRLFESAGSWTFFKLIATNVPEGEDYGPRSEITVQRYDVPFLDAEAMPDIIAEGMDTLPVRIVDPEWESVVPPVYLYRTSER